MMRAVCRRKFVDRKIAEKKMDMLGLEETVDALATANEVRWYGHLLKDHYSVF